MDIFITLFLVILILIVIGLIVFLLKKLSELQQSSQSNETERLLFDMIQGLRQEVNKSGMSNRQEMQQRLDHITNLMQHHSTNQGASIQKHLTSTNKVIEEITQKLTQVEATNKQILGFSTQLQSLENILKNPKQRGILGEYFLETLLAHVLQPQQYKIQYGFENGEIVDAAIFMQDKVIPIDAKFSLEKYNKIMAETDSQKREKLSKEFKADVKNRIDETAKYIRPKENTTDFAFMFIPAEGVYYNLLVYKVGSTDVRSQDLIEYAFSKRVIIVSPTSFFAYLQTVLQGLKALKMEKSVQDIVKRVGDLGKHISVYESYFSKVGNHLGTTVNSYNKAYKELKKIDKDVIKITDGEQGGDIEVNVIDGPAS